MLPRATVIFFGLMLFKFFTSEGFKLELSNAKRNPLTKWSEIQHFSPLLYLLLRDGVMYFAMYVKLPYSSSPGMVTC